MPGLLDGPISLLTLGEPIGKAYASHHALQSDPDIANRGSDDSSMILGWFRRRRRARLLNTPFPAEWLPYLEAVGHYQSLTAAEQQRLQDDLRVFVSEKNWEGCGGLAMTDEMRVTVAALACLLVIGHAEHEYFSQVLSILIYPTGYAIPEHQEGSVFIEEGIERLGEAWYRGPVILSWEDVLYDSRHRGNGQNLVLHEFAHQLDMLNYGVDGTPPLANQQQARRWRDVMTAEYERLIEDTEAGRVTLLDDYGASNEAEFFAVATECFFELPRDMQAEHPELYSLLADYYQQDPAKRPEPPNAS